MGLPVTVTTSTFPRKVSMSVGIILANFLEELHHPEMQDFLSYVINELAVNAKNANTKRVYFAEKKLDLNNEADYNAGTRVFKTAMLEDAQHYLQLQKDAGLNIKIVMQYSAGDFIIEVRNNSELTEIEYNRISEKIENSKNYTALEEVLPEEFNDNEGSGLGLIISLLMLRKIGMPDENFSVDVGNGETIIRIAIPMIGIPPASIYSFSKQVTSYIEAVPRFPDSIIRVEHLLNDPNMDMSDVATIIASDVALSADLLKLVNSASYGLSQKVASIPYAVNLLGTRGLRNLIYSVGVMNVLDSDSERQSELWAQSYRAAFYANWIARNKVPKAGLNDLAYVCGLLYRLGKIVLSLVYPDPDLESRILKLKEERNIPDNVFNMLTSEINCPEIGAALAEKWNFPPAIVNAIRFQHNYEGAPEEFRTLVALVSLVDIIIHYQEGDIDFSQISPDHLKIFSISGEDQFKELSDRLDTEFAASLAAERAARGEEDVSKGSD